MSERSEINGEIRAYQVRLIDENGVQQGIKSYREAMYIAQSLELDLVKITDSTPPVCKIVDAGKYFYEQQKQKKAQAKKQRAAHVETKEIQLRPVTDINDIKIKAKKSREFLSDGDKVRIVLRFRGREAAHKDMGKAVMDKFLLELGETKVEQELKDTGKEFSIILAPLPQKQP